MCMEFFGDDMLDYRVEELGLLLVSFRETGEEVSFKLEEITGKVRRKVTNLLLDFYERPIMDAVTYLTVSYLLRDKKERIRYMKDVKIILAGVNDIPLYKENLSDEDLGFMRDFSLDERVDKLIRVLNSSRIMKCRIEQNPNRVRKLLTGDVFKILYMVDDSIINQIVDLIFVYSFKEISDMKDFGEEVSVLLQQVR